MRSERARHNKIIFSGTVGAGKSTAIAALSDIPPVATEAVATDETSQLKKTTTVAMDYGVLNLPDGVRPGAVSQAAGQPLPADAGAASDRDVVEWVGVCKRSYDTCRGRLAAIAEFHQEQGN